MNRRFFLALTTAVTLALPAMAGFIAYEPGVIENALAEGKTVFVDYHATWCVTCKAQKRVLDKLLRENPAYEAAMTFVRVDWDTYSEHEVTTSRNIPRRSVLIVLKGDQELGRIVADTSEEAIKALLDLGL